MAIYFIEKAKNLRILLVKKKTLLILGPPKIGSPKTIHENNF